MQRPKRPMKLMGGTPTADLIGLPPRACAFFNRLGSLGARPKWRYSYSTKAMQRPPDTGSSILAGWRGISPYIGRLVEAMGTADDRDRPPFGNPNCRAKLPDPSFQARTLAALQVSATINPWRSPKWRSARNASCRKSRQGAESKLQPGEVRKHVRHGRLRRDVGFAALDADRGWALRGFVAWSRDSQPGRPDGSSLLGAPGNLVHRKSVLVNRGHQAFVGRAGSSPRLRAWQ